MSELKQGRKEMMKNYPENQVVTMKQVGKHRLKTRKVSFMKVKVKSLSRVRLFATPWTVAYQAPLFMGFPFQARILEWIAISFSIVL